MKIKSYFDGRQQIDWQHQMSFAKTWKICFIAFYYNSKNKIYTQVKIKLNQILSFSLNQMQPFVNFIFLFIETVASVQDQKISVLPLKMFFVKVNWDTSVQNGNKVNWEFRPKKFSWGITEIMKVSVPA